MRKIIFLMLIAFCSVFLNAQWADHGTLHFYNGPSTPQNAFIGNFIGSYSQDILLINRSTRDVFLYSFWLGNNSTNNQYITRTIGNWDISTSDQFYVGKMPGSSRNYLMTYNPSKKLVKFYTFSTTKKDWEQIYSSSDGWMGNWCFNSGDRFILSDFTGNGEEEILCMSENGFVMLLRFNGKTLDYVWSNGGNGYLGGSSGINIKNGTLKKCIFSTGYFTSATGPKELFIFMDSWAKIVRFNPSRNDWDWVWSQSGDNNFATWALPLNSQTKIIGGRFSQSTGRHQLLFLQHEKSGTSPKATLIAWNQQYRTFQNIWTIHKRNFTNNVIINDANTLYAIKEYNNKHMILHINGKYAKVTYWNGGIINSSIINQNGVEFDFIDDSSIEIYPNPATDHININYDLEQNIELLIYSTEGKIMERVNLETNFNSKKIDTSHYPAGIYMYKYGKETGKFIIK